ncbi:MAG: hypothetical protein ABSH48_23000 [Verrucomicrobiota bacterium]|jgi:hypothetical protein
MNTALQFRSWLVLGGEILTGQVPFLPVGPAQAGQSGPADTTVMQYMAAFLPFDNINGKHSTVAQPLLNKDLQ